MPVNSSTELGTEDSKERIHYSIRGTTQIAVWQFTFIPETSQSTWAFTGTDPKLRLAFNPTLRANDARRVEHPQQLGLG